MAIVPRAVFIGAALGLLSSAGLVYYVSKAVSPGIFGMFAIMVIAVLFGIFVGLSSAALSLLVNLKRFFSGSGNCANCSNEFSGNVNFCPHCGKKSIYFNVVKL